MFEITWQPVFVLALFGTDFYSAVQMLLHSLLLIVLFQNCVCEEESGPRIIGGMAVRPEDYPFVVSVFPWGGLCGGSMIALDWVLTAAHCIKPATLHKGIKVRTGFNYSAEFIQIRYVRTAIIHPKLRRDLHASGKDIRYDIALLKLYKPFKRTTTLNTIELPPIGYTKLSSVATVCGIGREGPGDSAPLDEALSVKRPLKCTLLHITEGRNCRDTFVNAIALEDGNVIYTLEAKGLKNPCPGDSGGPLFCSNVLIGVISIGVKCGTATKCAAYTSVEHSLDFIQKYTHILPAHAKDSPRKSGVRHRNACHVWWLAIFVTFTKFLQ